MSAGFGDFGRGMRCGYNTYMCIYLYTHTHTVRVCIYIYYNCIHLQLIGLNVHM